MLGPPELSADAQGVSVEPRRLYVDLRDGRMAKEAAGHGVGGVHPVLERRGEPPIGAASVFRSWRPVAAVGGSPPVPVPPAPRQAVLDLVAPVPDLPRNKTSPHGDLPPGSVELPLLVGQRDAGPLRSRIDAQLHTLDFRFLVRSVLQPDHEGHLPDDDRTALGEELTGTGRMTGHQGLSVRGEHEDPARRYASLVGLGRCGSVTAPGLCRSRRSSGRAGVTPTGLGARPLGLPSPKFPAGAPRRGGVPASRFVPAPGGVCSHGFQCRALRKHTRVGRLAHRKRSHRIAPL